MSTGAVQPELCRECFEMDRPAEMVSAAIEDQAQTSSPLQESLARPQNGGCSELCRRCLRRRPADSPALPGAEVASDKGRGRAGSRARIIRPRIDIDD